MKAEELPSTVFSFCEYGRCHIGIPSMNFHPSDFTLHPLPFTLQPLTFNLQLLTVFFSATNFDLNSSSIFLRSALSASSRVFFSRILFATAGYDESMKV